MSDNHLGEPDELNGSPDSPTGGARTWAPPNKPRWKRLLASLVATIVLTATVTGVLAYELGAAHSGKGSGSSGAAATVASVNTHTVKTCASLTTCTTTAISAADYSSILVFVTAKSVTAPSGISSSPSHSWTTEGHISSSTTSNREVYAYLTDNVTSASTTVTVTFAASTIYDIFVIDIKGATTASVDSVGAGTAGGVSLSNTIPGTASITTTATANVANDVMFGACGINDTANRVAITDSGGTTVIDTAGGTGIQTAGDGDKPLGSATGSQSFTCKLTGPKNAGYQYACLALTIKSASVPRSPSSLSAGTITSTSIALSWVDGAGPVVNETVKTAPYTTSCGSYTTHHSTGGKMKAYTITGLSPGMRLCIEVTAWNTTGESLPSSPLVNIQTGHVPAAPTGLTLIPVTGTVDTLLIYFVQPPAGGSLDIDNTLDYYSGVGCSGSPTTLSVGTQTGVDFNYSLSGLSSGTIYSAKVTATNTTGTSSPSICASGTTNSLPSSASGIGASAVGSNSVTLTWVDPSSPPTLVNITILYGKTCGVWTRISAGTGSSHTVPALDPQTTYCFTVETWSDGGLGPITHPYLNVTTTGGTPSPPHYLNLTSSTTTSLSVSWVQGNPGSEVILNNTVFAGTSCGTKIASTWSKGAFSTFGGATTFTINSLSAGTNYCIGVSAWDASGESSLLYGNFSTLNPAPGAPTGLTEISASHLNITFNWTNHPLSGPILNTTLAYTTTAGCSAGLSYVSMGAVSTYDLTGLVAFTSYYLKVQSWSNSGASAFSSCVQMVTQNPNPPAPVINQTATTSGSTWIHVVWSNPALYTLFNSTVLVGYTCGSTLPPFTGWARNIDTHAVTNNWNVSSLSPNTTYCVSVVVWDGPSNGSSTVNFTTTILVGHGGVTVIFSGPAAAIGLVFLVLLVFLILVLWLRRRDRRSSDSSREEST